MFVGMNKTFWVLRVSFIQIKKSQATKLHQIPLFHITTGVCQTMKKVMQKNCGCKHGLDTKNVWSKQNKKEEIFCVEFF